MKLIAQGAEAQIFKDKDTIIKKRLEKPYRLKEIDVSLRKKRTQIESTILKRLEGIAPRLLEKDKFSIKMEYLKGKLLVDILDKKPHLAAEIGKAITILHNKNVAHGDLTTSNMIFTGKKVRLIDFGLSKISHKIEDKAVDLHLLKQAIVAKHYKVEKKVWPKILNNYNPENKQNILKRWEKVQERGRNKK